MVETFHIAAQYLATSAISFLDPKEDDSHTNLGWKDNALHTHSLTEKGDTLSLDYVSFSLQWTNNNGFYKSIFLDEKSHSEIIVWIQDVANASDIKSNYEYNLHYELPYAKIMDDFKFVKPEIEVINQLIAQRNLAHNAMLAILNNDIAVRIWPHHFDSGAFYTDNNGIGIGIGMAIPDTMISDFYLYVSGYRGHDNIELSDTAIIKYGRYYNGGWKGIALPVSRIHNETAISFYKNTITNYTNLLN